MVRQKKQSTQYSKFTKNKAQFNLQNLKNLNIPFAQTNEETLIWFEVNFEGLSLHLSLFELLFGLRDKGDEDST